MEIFDRLVLERWVRNFLLACGAFFLLLTVVTVLASFTRTSVTLMQVFQNYFYELPKWTGQITPFACLVASLFSIDQLRNRNELVSLYSLGYSPWRGIVVVALVAAVIGSMQFYVSSFVTPYFNHLRHQWILDTGANFKQDDLTGSIASKKTSRSIWYKLPQGHMSFVAVTETGEELREVEIVYVNPQQQIETIVIADKAYYKKNNLWEFSNAKIFRGLTGEGFPEFRHEDLTSYTLLETPENIQKVFSDVAALPLPGLRDYIRNIKRTGVDASTFEILFWEKYNTGVVCLLFALIPISGLFSPGRRHTKVGGMIFFTVAFATLYYLAQSGLTAFGRKGAVHPWIAVFGTTVVFALYLSQQLLRHRKL